MKVIFDYCRQIKPYGDSKGQCLVQLEENETINDVKAKYVKDKWDWFDVKYGNLKEIPTYTDTTWKGETVIHTGRLVLMDTFQTYLD